VGSDGPSKVSFEESQGELRALKASAAYRAPVSAEVVFGGFSGARRGNLWKQVCIALDQACDPNRVTQIAKAIQVLNGYETRSS
jgi:hypothetical protein